MSLVDSRQMAQAAVKADEPLQRTLKEARGHDKVRAMLVLKAVDQTPRPDPSSFSSRRSYRAAVRRNSARARSEAYEPLRRQLESLATDGLKVNAEPASSVVVVEGPPAAVVQAVNFDQVEVAALDESYDLATAGESSDARASDVSGDSQAEDG